MKKLIIFIMAGLKVFELSAFFGVIIGIAYHGRFIQKIIYGAYCISPFRSWKAFGECFFDGLIVGIIIPAFIIIALMGIGYIICELWKLNLEWSSKIVNKLNRKGNK